MTSAPCLHPLSEGALLGWWTGHSPGRDARATEAHLLGCGACSARAEELATVAHVVREEVRNGRLTVVVPRRVLAALEQEGRRVREYRVAAGGAVKCTVAPDDDVVAASLATRGFPPGRLDLLVQVGDGPEVRFGDVPHAGGEEVILLPSVAELRAMPAHVQRIRLLLVTAEGERELARYTFDHSPWPR